MAIDPKKRAVGNETIGGEVEHVGFLPTRRRTVSEARDLTTLLHAVKMGDSEARNQLLEQYTPFVLKVASQAARRYIDRMSDDEFSIALAAFNEAIDIYDVTRSVGFLALAETVMKRRLIDEFRKQNRGPRQSPWSEYDVHDEDDNVVNYVDVRSSLDHHARAEESADRVFEIEEFAAELAKFKLSFEDLVKSSPKHEDARENAFQVARLISGNPQWLTYVQEKKSLPLKELEQVVAVSRKTLERQRKYILAVVLLLAGDYPCLQEYVRSTGREYSQSSVKSRGE